MMRRLPWALAAAVAAPLAIVVHELGHFIVGLTFGFPDLVLHYGNVSDGAAKAGFPAWQQGLQAAAGPLVTMLIVLGCCAAARGRVKHLAITTGLAAGVRSVGIGVAYGLARMLGRDAQGNFDEMNAAKGLGLSPELLIGLNVLIVAGAWVFLISRVPAGNRFSTLGAVAVGTAAGVAVYAMWLGPLLLP
jgi:hypothetical protein